MKKTLLLALVLVSLFAVGVSAVDLSYNLKVGSSYVQSTKTTFNMGMNVTVLPTVRRFMICCGRHSIRRWGMP